MSTASPESRQLARRLVAHETARGEAGGAARACEMLRATLMKLVGVSGYRSLIARAVAMAKAEHPSLDAVRVLPDGSLQLFDGVGRNQDAEAVAAVVAQLLGLLETFIGRPLTLRLVRDIWPDFFGTTSIDGIEEGP